MNRTAEMGEELLRLLRAALEAQDNQFATLGKRGVTNVVVDLRPGGLWVSTGASDVKASPPQLIPAWMMVTAWDHLRTHGTLSNKQLLHELNVMRSSAVCALLALLPGILVESGPAILLRWVGAPPEGPC